MFKNNSYYNNTAITAANSLAVAEAGASALKSPWKHMKTVNENTVTETIDEHVEAAIVKVAVDLANTLNSFPQFVELGNFKPELKKYKLCLWNRVVYEKQPDGTYAPKGRCDLTEVRLGSVKVYACEGSRIQPPE